MHLTKVAKKAARVWVGNGEVVNMIFNGIFLPLRARVHKKTT